MASMCVQVARGCKIVSPPPSAAPPPRAVHRHMARSACFFTHGLQVMMRSAEDRDCIALSWHHRHQPGRPRRRAAERSGACLSPRPLQLPYQISVSVSEDPPPHSLIICRYHPGLAIRPPYVTKASVGLCRVLTTARLLPCSRRCMIHTRGLDTTHVG